jgi:hypothetical protein
MQLATQLNPKVGSARARDVAQSHVTESRRPAADGVGIGRRARQHLQQRRALPLDFPSAPGQPPLLDKNVAARPPQRDRRLHDDVAGQQDEGHHGRVRGARTTVQAASADLANEGEVAAFNTANAYLAVLRADAVYNARFADSTLAASLLSIAQDQLRAGTGVGLDVTRARSQLTGARTQLIVGATTPAWTPSGACPLHRDTARHSGAR